MPDRTTDDTGQRFALTPFTIVAGKGGVGKTTVAALLATLAARQGERVLVVATDRSPGWQSLFGADALTHAPQSLAPGITARCLTPEDSLREYLDDRGLKRLSGRLMSLGVTDVVATAAPGIAQLLVLGKVKQLVRSGEWDRVVLDAPAAGHALTFLSSPQGLADAVGSGAIREQADDVTALLADRSMTSVVLVTLPAETPVSELIETAYSIEDRIDVGLGPVVVNAVLPAVDGLGPLDITSAKRIAKAEKLKLTDEQLDALVAAAAHHRAMHEAQGVQLARLVEQLPVPHVHLPRLPTTALGSAEREQLTDALKAQVMV
jgi:anion-transporting  ArsA/GET3 family ATPase